MKISAMLMRENFYEILYQTLDSYFTSEKLSTMFVYPKLNAIITRFPSKEVKSFLYTEYRVDGNLWRRICVWLYTRICLHSAGLFSSKRIKVHGEIHKNILIYPCNKKIRIFDFQKDIVDVIVKEGFSTASIQNEISFRLSNPIIGNPILEHGELWYRESIIKGVPVARLTTSREEVMKAAYATWDKLRKKEARYLPVTEYGRRLRERYKPLRQSIEAKKQISLERLDRIFYDRLFCLREYKETICVCLSHGDIQPGNMWLAEDRSKVYIIDWESHDFRYDGYDYAVLFENIRMRKGLRDFARSERTLHNSLVLLEDILYRMDEFLQLPHNYGKDEFDDYLNTIK